MTTIIQNIKNALKSVPDQLSNASKRTLEMYGEQPISSIFICRTPLNKTLDNVVNTISFGRWKEVKQDRGYQNMYHVSLLFTLMNNAEIINEKNEFPEIKPLKESSSLNKQTQYYGVGQYRQGTIKLSDFIDNTIKFMGETKFFDYKGFKNNCMVYCSDSLKANNLWTQDEENFIMQDFEGMNNDMKKTGHGYVESVVNAVTNLGSRVGRLVGKGRMRKNKYDKIIKVVYPYFEKAKFRFL